MKKLFISFVLLAFAGAVAFAQTDKITGKWKTIDDKD